MTTATDVIDGMLALYAGPDTWTRHGIAQDAAGRSVDANSPKAVAWSLDGALERVIGDWEDPNVEHAENIRRQDLLAAVGDACGVDLSAFNDAACRQDAVTGLLQRSRSHAPT